MKQPNHELYSYLKRQWIKNNPDAPSAEYDAAIREIARRCGV